jgi:hypothetical protein
MDPRRLLPYLVALTACAVLATAVLVGVSQHPPTTAVPVSTAPPTPRDTLADWDARRADAWATGDVSALRDLYVPGSRTGRADVRMLSAYVDRGLRVEGLTTQVLGWEVIAQSRDTLTLMVTDRVVGGVVAGAGTRVPLPRDRATTRTVSLRRAEDGWRVREVRDQPRAADSTSRTSTSWKS